MAQAAAIVAFPLASQSWEWIGTLCKGLLFKFFEIDSLSHATLFKAITLYLAKDEYIAKSPFYTADDVTRDSSEIRITNGYGAWYFEVTCANGESKRIFWNRKRLDQASEGNGEILSCLKLFTNLSCRNCGIAAVVMPSKGLAMAFQLFVGSAKPLLVQLKNLHSGAYKPWSKLGTRIDVASSQSHVSHAP